MADFISAYPSTSFDNAMSIQDNLTSTDINKPLSANQGKVLNEKIGSIIESGSNANGSFVKFSDGTMIQTTKATLAYVNATQLQILVTLPLSFINTSYVPIFTANQIGSTVGMPDINPLIKSSGTVSGFYVVMRGTGFVPTSTVVCDIVVIGKWK